MQVNAKVVTSGAEALQHARAVIAKRRRMFASIPSAPKQKPQFAKEAPIVEPAKPEPVKVVNLSPFREMPEWKRERIEFDAHVVDQRSFLGRPMAMYIARRATDFGFCYADLVRDGRLTVNEYAARDYIAAEMKAANSEVAWTELGRIFNRDHTSLFWGVHQIWADQGNEVSRAKIANRKERMDAAYRAARARRKAK